jgi:HD-like signal output (HDOD) protein
MRKPTVGAHRQSVAVLPSHRPPRAMLGGMTVRTVDAPSTAAPAVASSGAAGPGASATHPSASDRSGSPGSPGSAQDDARAALLAWIEPALLRVAPISPWALRLLSMPPEAEGRERELRELIASDPALLARVLGAASSRFHNPRGVPVTDVGQAMLRLGTREVWRIAAVVALGGSARIRPALRDARRALWTHSFTVAHAARLVAESATAPGADPDRCFVAGLLHDIGLLLLLSAEPKQCESLLPAIADPAIGFSDALEAQAGLPPHAAIGAEACRRWGLPPELVALVGLHGRALGVDLPEALHADALALELAHRLSMAVATTGRLFRRPSDAATAPLCSHLGIDAARLEALRDALAAAGPRIAALSQGI